MFLKISCGGLKIKYNLFFRLEEKRNEMLAVQEIYRPVNTAVTSASVMCLHFM